MVGKIYVNAMGEVYRGHAYILGSTGDPLLRSLLEAAKKHHSEPINDRECLWLWKAALAVLGLTDKEVEFVATVWKLQQHNDDLSRVQGTGNKLELAMEFKEFDDNKEFWKEFKTHLRGSTYRWGVIWTGEHCDEWKNHGDRKWTRGPRHGDLCTQVEVCCPVSAGTSSRELRRMKAKMKVDLWDRWPKQTVGVL